VGDEDFIRKSLLMVGGLIVWGVHFGVIYTLNSLACTRDFADASLFGFALVPTIVVGTTFAALLAAGAVLVAVHRQVGPARDDRPVNEFLRSCTLALTALALVAIAWNGVPALLVPPCA